MSMAKSGGRTQHDNLEIESMGTLYKGEWEKKYWSCSRGKERHPYPVGYKATRRHGGHNYSMEIGKGMRGPLFSVSCEEGLSSSGNSTTVVWDNMLRKKHVGAKKLHSAIDGSELFGFTNPTVQRLFQDLVAAEEAPKSGKSLNETISTTEDSSIACRVTPAISSRKQQGQGSPQESLQINPRQLEGVVSEGSNEKQTEVKSTVRVQKGLKPSRQINILPNASDQVLECSQEDVTRDALFVPSIEVTTIENNPNTKRNSLESNTMGKSLESIDTVYEGRTSRDHLTSNTEMSEEPNWMKETAKYGKEVLQYKRRSQGRVEKEVVKQSAQKAIVSSVGHGAGMSSQPKLHTVKGKGSHETKALTLIKKQPLQEATISSPGQFLLPTSDAKLEDFNLHSVTKKQKVGSQAREPPEQQLNSNEVGVHRDTTEGMVEGTSLRETNVVSSRVECHVDIATSMPVLECQKNSCNSMNLVHDHSTPERQVQLLPQKSVAVAANKSPRTTAAPDPLVVEEGKQPKTADKLKRMQLARPSKRSKAKFCEPAVTTPGGINSYQAPSDSMHEKRQDPSCFPQTPSPEASKAPLCPESCIPHAGGVRSVVEDGAHMILEASRLTGEHLSTSQRCKVKLSEPLVIPDTAKLTEFAASTTGMHVKDPEVPVRNASPLPDAESFATTGDSVGEPHKHDNFKGAQAGILARANKRSQSGADVKGEETKLALEIWDRDQGLSMKKVKKDGESCELLTSLPSNLVNKVNGENNVSEDKSQCMPAVCQAGSRELEGLVSLKPEGSETQCGNSIPEHIFGRNHLEVAVTLPSDTRVDSLSDALEVPEIVSIHDVCNGVSMHSVDSETLAMSRKAKGQASSVRNTIWDGHNAASLQQKDGTDLKEITATMDSFGVDLAIGISKDQRAACCSAEDFLGLKTMDNGDCKLLEDPQPLGANQEAGQCTTSEGSFKFSAVCIPSSLTAVKNPDPVVVVSECRKEDASNDEHMTDVTDGRLMVSGARTVLPLNYEVDLDAETEEEKNSPAQGVKSPAPTCVQPEEIIETSQALFNSGDSMGNGEYSMGTNVTNYMVELLFPQTAPLLDAGLTKKRKQYSDNHPSVTAPTHRTAAEEVCVKHDDSAATDVNLDTKNMPSMDLLLIQAPLCIEQWEPLTHHQQHTKVSLNSAQQDLIQKVESNPNLCAGKKPICQLQQEVQYEDYRELELETPCARPSSTSECPERHEVNTLQPAVTQNHQTEEKGSHSAVELHGILLLKDSVGDKDGHMSSRLIGSTMQALIVEEQESKQQSMEMVKEIKRDCMPGSPEAPQLKEGIGLGPPSNKEAGSIEAEATEDQKSLLTPEKAVRKAVNDEDISVPAAGLDHEGLPSGFEGVVRPSDILEPVGAFGHPAPVRAVILNVLGTTVHLCVCCGSLEDHKRLLFVHKLDVQDVCNVAASLLGVVETELCHDDDATPSAEFAIEESAICFTPDGQELIMLDCFQLPESSLGESMQLRRKIYSPLKKISTPQQNGCPATANGSSKDGGHQSKGAHNVKVVSFKEGTKVRATLRCKQKLRCLVVPGANTLIGAGDKSYIQCWKMDTSWRKCEESFTLPSPSYQGEQFDSISQLLVVPGLPHLIFGCHHSGSFAIWDYIKGTLLSASQTPDYCVHRAQLLELPHDVEQSKSKAVSPMCLVKNPSTTLGFAAKNLLGDVKQGPSDIPIIHLLVMASPREDDFNFYLEESDTLGFEEACTTADPDISKRRPLLPGSCRMGIMRDNHVAIGIPLETKASAATTLGRYGVMGTTEGELYIWEIVTGEKVGVFPELQGSPITCIAAHPVGSVLAAAGIENLVVVYAKGGS